MRGHATPTERPPARSSGEIDSACSVPSAPSWIKHPSSVRVAEVQGPVARAAVPGHVLRREHPYIRIATFLGGVTWAAFGPLALLVVDDEGVVLDSVIRYGLGVPTGLVSLALTHLPNYRRIWQPMITAAILFSGLVWVIHRAFVVDARAGGATRATC